LRRGSIAWAFPAAGQAAIALAFAEAVAPRGSLPLASRSG
jgi:hypothetical protein